ncbi:hypothetical protein CFOL_v3_16835, partial [Cephalotus follicularis]
DDYPEGPVSSFVNESFGFNQSEDVLSPEDLAWVDSCLAKDRETSDIDWNCLKDALLDILTIQPESLDFSVGDDSFLRGTDIEILSSSEEVKGPDIEMLPSSEELEGTDIEILTSIEDVEEDIGIPMSQVLQGDLSEPFIGNAYLLKSKDGLRESEVIDSGYNLVSSIYEVEPSTKDIFCVWDLDIPAEEEDELVKQLTKALEESSVDRVSSTLDDLGALQDFKDDSLDNLIAGISELSL